MEFEGRKVTQKIRQLPNWIEQDPQMYDDMMSATVKPVSSMHSKEDQKLFF